MLTGWNMVRRYKKKPFYEAAKIPQETVFKVVAGYTMGYSARFCGEKVGISRQSVQKIYTAIGERVIWLLEGHYPTSNNKLGDFLTKFGDVAVFNDALELIKKNAPIVLSQYGAEITYEDFKNYREYGKVAVDGERGKNETSTTHAFRYRLLKFLIRISERNYGIREAQYPRHYAFAKLYIMVLTVMMSQLNHDTLQTGVSHAEIHKDILEKVEEDKRSKLETMIFEAKCNMVITMLLVFSLYQEAI